MIKSADMFVRTKEDVNLRKLIGITLKNIIKNCWENEMMIPMPVKAVKSG